MIFALYCTCNYLYPKIIFALNCTCNYLYPTKTNITALSTHSDKDANLNAKEQCCGASDGPKKKIFLVHSP